MNPEPARDASRRRFRGLWPAAALALVLLRSAAAAPATADQEKALASLAAQTGDDAEACVKALDAVVGVTDKKALDKVVDFGMNAWRPALTLRAADVLLAAGPDQAAAALDRAKPRAGTRADKLTRLVQMIERVPGKAGTTLLIDFLTHPDEFAVSAAARALGARGDVVARTQIEALLKSPKPAVAISAAHALARFPADDKLREELWSKADSASMKDHVGDNCALALSTMEGAKEYGLKALDVAAGRATSDSFHALAKLAIRTLDTVEPAKLLHLMDQKSEVVKGLGCDLAGLTACKDEKVQEKLLDIARGEGSWRTRVGAWLALRRTGSEHVADGVARAIAQSGENSYWGIQCAVKGPRDVNVAPLREAALDTKDPVRRELAARALNLQPQRDQSRTFLVKAAREGTPKQQQMAYLSLGALQDEATFDLLVSHLAERTDAFSRLSIVKGLEKLTGHYYKPDPEVWKAWKKAVDGDVVYVPHKADRKANRQEKSLAERGVTPKTETAVESGLSWFAEHQDADGDWNGDTFDERCPDRDCRAQGGIRDRDLAYTGLGCLAFTGAGYDHVSGAYRDVVHKGFEAILSRQEWDGAHEENGWTFSYEAAIVCHALCDGYLLTGDPWLKQGAQRMIDYLVKTQFPGGAWRYHVRSGEADTSVTSWMSMAAVAARTAGLDVPEQLFVGIEGWLDKASDPVPEGEFEVFEPSQFKADNRYGIDVKLDEQGKPRTFKLKTWYQPPKLYTPACTCINLITRIWYGKTRAHPMCIGNANQIASCIPGYGTGFEHEYAFYPYTWYYGSMAMYQMGGTYWNEWKSKCVDDVLAHQNTEGHLRGSWTTPRGELVAGLTGGRMFCTAMGILTLETFYRYPPYLSRASTRGTSKDEREGKDKGDGGAAPPAPPPAGK